jgi:hypothetical protein
MLKHTSVGSSTPQVRSGNGLRRFAGEMNKYSEVLETMIFPTYNIVKETSQNAIQQNLYHVWKRPAHLRSHWLILSENSPALLVDIRNSDNVWSLKFPYDTRQVQKVGPIICEVAYDSQESTLWIWDLVVWEKKNIWSSYSYSERWSILQKSVRPLIYENHPMCDISIKYPSWLSMKEFLNESDEVGYSYEFQPEKAGLKRLLWLIPKAADTFKPTSFHERKMVSETTCIIVPEEPETVIVPAVIVPTPTVVPVKHANKLIGLLLKDKLSKLPDTYKLFSESGDDLGLAAVRSMEMSSKLRSVGPQGFKVELVWYESFQKYEVQRIIST